MSMFMAAMRQAAEDGELNGMGMFGASLKQEVAEYARRLAGDADRHRFFRPAQAEAAESKPPPSINTLPTIPPTRREP